MALLISAKINSQIVIREKPSPVLYLAYQPWDHGLGIREDIHFTNWFGMYGSASYGTLGLYKYAGLKDHFKATIGFLIPLEDYRGNHHRQVCMVD